MIDTECSIAEPPKCLAQLFMKLFRILIPLAPAMLFGNGLTEAARPNVLLILADDLSTDRAETNNLADQSPERVSEMAKLWKVKTAKIEQQVDGADQFDQP